jgi:glyoxylase-like metal-dependent hydrolase (beta-lactamase superfamily II)
MPGMRFNCSVLSAALLLATAASAQTTSPMLSEDTVRVSEHVWAIIGFPNIGIVVGNGRVLVVDTGLGARNGATVARVAAKLAPNARLYLTTTHFHPEHAAGEGGFPAGTILIRNAEQQRELEARGLETVAMFSAHNDEQKQLLANVTFRQPDVIYDSQYKLDLGGGVQVRLLWFGGAHTKGDELVFVDPDKTLISGDVVQNKAVPRISVAGGTPSSWIAVLDQIKGLGARHVLPDHSPIGDGSLVASERAYIVDLRTRALELKSQGIAVNDAGERLTQEFNSRYPGWSGASVSGFVQSVYAE